MLPAVHCENLSKFYESGEPRRSLTLREAVPRALGSTVRGMLRLDAPEAHAAQGAWVLRNISLDVFPGEVVGVVGSNGAGKSTLLKILSRITKPTSGRAEIRGRVGTLLEVGTGFHMQLTGRENIYLNGAVLGMTRREIAASFDDIVDFSQCGDALDVPIRHYSSGMQVRLAFAVAAHLRAEILLVDEVLAVADVAFQKKCLGKIGEMAGQGRTVFFTSHNLLAIESLCTRAICLNKGDMVMAGDPRAVTSAYLKQWMPPSSEIVFATSDASAEKMGLRLHRAGISAGEMDARSITVRTPLTVDFEYSPPAIRAGMELSAEVFNEHGISVFCTPRLPLQEVPGGRCRSGFTIPGDLMNRGAYRVTLDLFLGEERVQWPDLLVFDVHEIPERVQDGNFAPWPGAVRPRLLWSTRSIADSAESHR